MPLSNRDLAELEQLEEGLWRADIRFDLGRMDEILAPDFFEFGRSSRVYERADTLAVPAGPIDARLPLMNFKARLLDVNVVQVTYVSAVTYDGVELRGLRSSIWSRTANGWQLRFHQGTPIPGLSCTSEHAFEGGKIGALRRGPRPGARPGGGLPPPW